MNEIRFKPFLQQKQILKDPKRFIGAFAGKRGGKTEVGAIKGIMLQEQKPNHIPNDIDPYLGVIAAPTIDMLRRLSWKKFNAYAAPMISKSITSPFHISWHDGSEVIGVSADRPERIEGVKAGWIWIDEVFQVSEHFFLECMARVADTEGYVICTGSLGVQYVNPKQHWAYKYFKESIDFEFSCYEWTTLDNPYFPKREYERLRALLDPQTFRAMFTINWDTIPTNAVYSQLSDNNLITNYKYNPNLPTYISIDWGWAHPMAAGFFQVDEKKNTVYLFDEIVGSKITLDSLWDKITKKNYRLDGWVCDIAGNQEREQTGRSNIDHFKDNYQIGFKYRKTAINYGIPIVRSYIKNTLNQARFLIDEKACPRSVDGLKRYRYPEKDGIVQNENPIKMDDDECDMIRYFFVNIMDKSYNRPRFNISRTF